MAKQEEYLSAERKIIGDFFRRIYENKKIGAIYIRNPIDLFNNYDRRWIPTSNEYRWKKNLRDAVIEFADAIVTAMVGNRRELYGINPLEYGPDWNNPPALGDDNVEELRRIALRRVELLKEATITYKALMEMGWISKEPEIISQNDIRVISARGLMPDQFSDIVKTAWEAIRDKISGVHFSSDPKPNIRIWIGTDNKTSKIIISFSENSHMPMLVNEGFLSSAAFANITEIMINAKSHQILIDAVIECIVKNKIDRNNIAITVKTKIVRLSEAQLKLTKDSN